MRRSKVGIDDIVEALSSGSLCDERPIRRRLQQFRSVRGCPPPFWMGIAPNNTFGGIPTIATITAQSGTPISYEWTKDSIEKAIAVS